MYAMSHRILIVDDDPHIRQVLSFALGKAGMQTAEAGDGESALGAIAAQRPDLVVLDINMPRMSGLDVCRKLRAGDDLPILFLSFARRRDRPGAGLELGGYDYVVSVQPPRGGWPGSRDPEARRPGWEVEDGRAAARRAPPASARPAKLEAHGTTRPVRGGHRVPALLLLASLPLGVHRDTIIEPAARPGFAITDRTIDSHIRNLRAKCAAVGGTDLIETRAGIGYRLGACRGGGA